MYIFLPILFLILAATAAQAGSQDLEFQSGDLKLHGTLQMPGKSMGNQIAIFIHGSGPVSRDGVSRAKPQDPPIFKQLATFLEKEGIATFRFDKRILTYDAKNPPWDKEKFTPLDLIGDVRAAIKFVSSIDGFEDKKVILISHSEGGSYVPALMATDQKIVGAILLSPAFQSLDRALFAQFFPQLEEVNAEIQKASKAKERDDLKKTKVVLEEKLIGNGVAMMGAIRRGVKPLVPSYLGLSESYISAWLKLMDTSIYDLCDSKNPILVLGGEKDDQAPIADWVYAKAACLKSPEIRFMKLPRLGHLLVSKRDVVDASASREILKFIRLNE